MPQADALYADGNLFYLRRLLPEEPATPVSLDVVFAHVMPIAAIRLAQVAFDAPILQVQQARKIVELCCTGEKCSLRRIERLVQEKQHELLLEAWNGWFGNQAGERVNDVYFGDDTFSVDLVDGRTITVPYAWYPTLLHATPEQRGNWCVCGAGYGIHWLDLDEDLSTEGLLRGAPAPNARRTQASG